MTTAVRTGMFALVAWFVSRYAIDVWDSTHQYDLEFDSVSLILAGVLYIAPWLASVWGWERLLKAFGHNVPIVPVMRSYYCGHPGKYVPGKAAAILIRVALLKKYGVSAISASVTSVAETGLLMLQGLALSVLLIGVAVPSESLPAQYQLVRDVSPLTLLIITLLLSPVLLSFACLAANRVTERLLRATAARHSQGETSSAHRQVAELEVESFQPFTISFMTGSVAAFLATWFMQGQSLAMLIRSIGIEVSLFNSLIVCTTAVAAGTSIGFFAFLAPGGLAIREGIIIAIVTPLTGGSAAVIVAISLRALWFVSEIVVSALLFFIPADYHTVSDSASVA